MELIPEWAPNIHPILVHFPIAILSIAILLDFISFFLPQEQKWWTSEATAFLYGVGAATTVVVYFTGQSAADNVFLSAEAQSVLNNHADWALWTVWFYGIYALARILVEWQTPGKYSRELHITFFVLSLAGFFMLYQTGDNGARMVFKHGVGVQAAEMENREETAGKMEEEASDKTAFNVSENGDWSWEISSEAVQVLEERFHFLNGNIERLDPEVIHTDNDSHKLRFSGKNLDSFFVTYDNYQNVQIDYYLDLSDFDGTIILANHLQNEDNFDYVSLSSDGTVEQGRVSGGQTEVFEKGETDVSKPVFLRAVVNDIHFRGYIDEEMVVHGHGNAPHAGSAGLKLDGRGTVLIDKIELTQLN